MECPAARGVRARDRRSGGDRRGALALSRFCLDTSAYSWFRRGDVAVVDLVDAAEWIGMPAIVVGELHAGFRRGSNRRRNEEELDEFLGHAFVQELRVDGDVARIYGDIVHALHTKGTPIPSNDVWVAATAARAGAPLLAYDAHFSDVDRIGAIVLTPGA